MARSLRASRRLCTPGLNKLPAVTAERVSSAFENGGAPARSFAAYIACLADDAAAWAACMHDGDDRPHAARQEPAPGSQGSSCLLVPHFERPTEPQKQKDAKPGNEKTARLIHRVAYTSSKTRNGGAQHDASHLR